MDLLSKHPFSPILHPQMPPEMFQDVSLPLSEWRGRENTFQGPKLFRKRLVDNNLIKIRIIKGHNLPQRRNSKMGAIKFECLGE